MCNNSGSTNGTSIVRRERRSSGQVSPSTRYADESLRPDSGSAPPDGHAQVALAGRFTHDRPGLEGREPDEFAGNFFHEVMPHERWTDADLMGPHRSPTAWSALVHPVGRNA